MKRVRPFFSGILIFTCVLALQAQEAAENTRTRGTEEEREGNAYGEGFTAEPDGTVAGGLFTDESAEFEARMRAYFMPEDAFSLYTYKIGDKDIEFLVDGTWEAELSGGLTFTTGDNSSDAMEFDTPIFTQNVDLSAWTLIDNRWYFEAAFEEEFTKNSVAAGYYGKEGDLIQHIRVGNSGIVFPDYSPFVEVGGGNVIAPGITGTFAGKRWRADTLVRYDTATRQELRLSGMNEVNDEYIRISAMLTGKWFVLPDTRVRGQLSVYIEDANGTIVTSDAQGTRRRWRQMDSAEFSFTGSTGILELAYNTSKNVAVVYEGSYGSPGIAGAGLLSFVGETREFFDSLPSADMLPQDYLPDPAGANYADEVAARFLTEINGQSALMLKRNGYFSPFIIASRYLAEGTNELELIYEQSGLESDDLAVAAYDTAYAQIYRLGESVSSDRDALSRYPLAREFPLLYMPSFGGKAPPTGLSVRNRSYHRISSIALGTDVMNGTIQVTRNGIRDRNFSYDEDSGILTLEKTPDDGETLRITWLDTGSSAQNAILTAASGVRWNLTENLALRTAGSFQWNLNNDGYTGYGETSPGTVVASLGLDWKKNNFTFKTDAAYEFKLSDTTDHYRVEGMEIGDRILYPSSEWYKPADSLESVILGANIPAEQTLRRSDFVSLEGTGSGSLPAGEVAGISGSVLLMNATFTAPEQWTAANIETETYASTDFGTAKTVEIAIRNTGEGNAFSVYLQLGTATEEEFDDPATIRTFAMQAVPLPGTGWTNWQITLSDADRQALSGAQNMRVIVTPGSAVSPAAPERIRLQVGRIAYTEAGFTVTASAGGASVVSEVRECEDITSPALSSAYPEIIERFNDSETNSVLEAVFSDPDGKADFYLEKPVTQIPLELYGNIVFFLNVRKHTSIQLDENAEIEVSLLRERSGLSGQSYIPGIEGASVSFRAQELADGGWQKVEIDLNGKKVYIGGKEIPASHFHYDDEEYPDFIRFAFKNWPAAGGNGAEPWTVYLDEIYLTDSLIQHTVRNITEASWKKDGAILSLGGTTVFSDAELNVRAAANAGTLESAAGGAVSGGFTLLNARFRGSVASDTSDNRAVNTTMHHVEIPAGPVTFLEYHLVDFAGNSMRHQNQFSVNTPLSFLAATSLSQKSRYLERQTDGVVALHVPDTKFGKPVFETGVTLFQNGISPVTDLDDSAWNKLWTDSFKWQLSTGEPDAIQRQLKNYVKTGWQFPVALQRYGLTGIYLDTTVSSDYTAITGVEREGILSAEFSVPLQFTVNAFTFSWLREIERSGGEARQGGSYKDEADYLLSTLQDMDLFFKYAPFADLFAEGVSDALKDNGERFSRVFYNQYAFGWSRSQIGRVSDLFIPRAASLKIERESGADAYADIPDDEKRLSIQTDFHALNLAGRYGNIPIFTWYDQDEFAQVYKWTCEWSDTFFSWALDTRHSILFFLRDAGSLSFENIFHYNIDDVSQTGSVTRDTLRFVWKRNGKSSLFSAAIERLLGWQTKTRREDSFAWTSYALDSNSQNYFSFSAEYEHLLFTGIGEIFELKNGIAAALERTSDEILTVQLRLSLGGKLSF